MIAIMIPIKPYWFAKILNGEKNIEVRKNKALAKAIQKLIDTQGYAPILGYCTQDKQHFLIKDNIEKFPLGIIGYEYTTDYETKDIKYLNKERILNGKVPALLICRKVEEIKLNLATRFFTKSMNEEELLKHSYLTSKELEDYLWSNACCGYAIHINEVKIFDKPRELSEFYNYKYTRLCGRCCENPQYECDNDFPCRLTKAPQLFTYIDVD